MTPPSIISAQALSSVSSQIVTGIGSAIASESLGGPLTSVYYTNDASVTWDRCSCGLLALNVNRIYTSYGFPRDDTQSKTGNCDKLIVVADMTLTIVRCVVGPDENGEPPLAEDMIYSADVAFSDIIITRRELACILGQMYNSSPQIIADYLIGDDVPIGPLGNCGGRELHFKVAWFQDCKCGG